MVESRVNNQNPIKSEQILDKGDLQKFYKRKECDDLLIRKLFYMPSFEIYNGVAGLFDYGPLGSALKANVEALWRQHFVLEEDMLEVSCTCLTPEEVLKTSGHVDKFEDFMVKDMKNGQCHRVDKLIEEHCEKLLKKNLKAEEKEKITKIMHEAGGQCSTEYFNKIIAELKIKAPVTNNDLSEAIPFNLMFATKIGPQDGSKGYLRPETAQGIFVNFRKLNEYNNGRMPFAAAQIGLGFRNEIHPKQGLLRVREFTMAEIEHFVDPLNKTHSKFNKVKDVVLPLFSRENQITQERLIIRDMPLSEVVKQGIICNETLAYFMARTYLFLVQCGIRQDGIRFRQHRADEKAHYSQDCWDAEVETSYGWIEIAGHADRSCYDLTKHSQRTKRDLQAARPLKEPKTIKYIKITLNKKDLGPAFKKDAQSIIEQVENWNDEEGKQMMQQMEEKGEIVLKINDKCVNLGKAFLQFELLEKTIQEEKYIPSVIEPSFGIGRIVYCIFEHCFKIRPLDQQRTYFDFPPMIAPVKCSLLPLIDNDDLNRLVDDIKHLLIKANVSSKVDDSGQSIGKRYARTDECGIPFAITVDFDTINDNTVTLRDLASMKQVRIHINELAITISTLSFGLISWNDVLQKFPLFEAQAEK